MDIYVQGLTSEITVQDLRSTFERFGRVTGIKIVDREGQIPATHDLGGFVLDTSRVAPQAPKFAFVTMPDRQEAQAALQELQGSVLRSARLLLAESRERAPGISR